VASIGCHESVPLGGRNNFGLGRARPLRHTGLCPWCRAERNFECVLLFKGDAARVVRCREESLAGRQELHGQRAMRQEAGTTASIQM